MSALPQPSRAYLSPEDYLRREYDALEKHDYYRGEVLAMSGGSPRHSLIISNVNGELRSILKGRRCRAYESNLRVCAAKADHYFYPEATVVCGELDYDPLDRRQQTIVNPTAVVEVLSPTTEAYDRGAKFQSYQRIDSLRLYVLISQEAPLAETFTRQPEGTWILKLTVSCDSDGC